MQFLLFMGLFALGFILLGTVQLTAYKSYGISATDPVINFKDPAVLSMMKLMQGLSSILVFCLPALAFAFLVYTGRRSYFLGFRKAERENMYPLAAIAMVLSLPFVFFLGELNQRLPLPSWMMTMEKDTAEQMRYFLKANSSWDVIYNVFIIALLPAIGEELCFRAVLQRIMIHMTKNVWVGILIAAALFSALHLQFQGFFPRMFLGVLLGLLYWYSGSIWTAIVGHFLNNALQVLAVTYMDVPADKNPGIPILMAIISGIAVFAIVYFYRKQSTASWNKEFAPEQLHPENPFIS